jgi:phage gpG-like protein
MFEVPVNIVPTGSFDRMSAQTRARAERGTQRAAMIMAGALRRASASDPLHARTGMLARAWGVFQQGPFGGEFGGEVSVLIRNDNPYAAIHEFGGTIEPNKAKALAVPISGSPAVTARGVSRSTASIREAYPDLFVLRLATNKAYLARKAGKTGGRLEILFSLQQKVNMPARHYASLAVERSTNQAVAEIKKALEPGA